MIKQADPGAWYRAHRQAVDAAVARVLASGWYILGAEVDAFEAEFRRYLGCEFALGVASGTDALELALRAVGVGPDDTVATVSMTAVATAAAIDRTGAQTRFIDIDPQRMTLSPDALRAWLDDPGQAPPKAVIVVHLYGQPADMAAIAALLDGRGIALIEDCAQSHGATIDGRATGTWGDIGCFSMYPTKNLGAFGDAGAVVTNDPALYERLKLLRQYGWRQRFISSTRGFNSRLDEIQAAILRTRLPHLDRDNAQRRAIAACYDAQLAGGPLTLPAHIPGTTPVFHQYVVRSPDRDRLAAALKAQRIGTAIHYPAAVHQQPAYQDAAARSPALPCTEAATATVLSLPIYPELPLADCTRVGRALATAGRQE